MDIIEYGKKIIAAEIQSIQNMLNSVDKNFEKAVQIILNAKGKLVICGIGKSAVIGKKIVATLNSTGTHAAFLHAADAIHGDLGLLQQQDIVLLISKSGESNEMVYLLPRLKAFGNTIISMVGNVDSTLAKQADCVLNTSIESEAGEYNLAPTSSTTCQLVMGDALAMCLMKLKKFTATDFGNFHPGGALGKKLITIKQICRSHHAPFVFDDATFKNSIVEISKGRLGAVAVLNQEKKIVGIITDGDIRRAFENAYSMDKNAASLMNQHPQIIQENELASVGLEMMNQKNINQLLVINQQREYQAIVHLHDILKEGVV